MGAGAYICGEETSLLDSLEGKRGMVRAKPPLPAHPRACSANPPWSTMFFPSRAVPWIMANGAAAYAALGMGRSLGTLPVQLAGNVARGGLIELPFGVSLRRNRRGLGPAAHAPAGPFARFRSAGLWVPIFRMRMLDTPLDYEAFAKAGGLLGHGGVMVFDDSVDLAAQARFAFEFCAHESCGKCTPCRIGAVRGVEVMDRITAGVDLDRNFAVLDDLCELMTDASLCAMGGLTPVPVRSALTHFPEDFDRARHLPAAAE